MVSSCVFLFIAIFATSFFVAGRLAAQTNGIWNNTSAAGGWSSAINWQGGNVADGTGASADFSQQTMTNGITVHLDSSRNISGNT